MSIRLLFCGTMGVLETTLDVPPSMPIGGPMSIDVVVFGNVNIKGVPCEVHSKEVYLIPL